MRIIRAVWQKEFNQKIKEMYESGMPTREIGEQLGFDTSTIQRRLQRIGIKRRSHSEAAENSFKRGGRKDLKGKNSPYWKGGKYVDRDGYIWAKINDNKTGRRYFAEHRLVWEKEHGTLPEGWIVHHLNGIKDDNRIKNLEAMPNKNHSPKLIIEPFRKRIRELENIIANLAKEKP